MLRKFCIVITWKLLNTFRLFTGAHLCRTFHRSWLLQPGLFLYLRVRRWETRTQVASLRLLYTTRSDNWYSTFYIYIITYFWENLKFWSYNFFERKETAKPQLCLLPSPLRWYFCRPPTLGSLDVSVCRLHIWFFRCQPTFRPLVRIIFRILGASAPKGWRPLTTMVVARRIELLSEVWETPIRSDHWWCQWDSNPQSRYRRNLQLKMLACLQIPMVA